MDMRKEDCGGMHDSDLEISKYIYRIEELEKNTSANTLPSAKHNLMLFLVVSYRNCKKIQVLTLNTVHSRNSCYLCSYR